MEEIVGCNDDNTKQPGNIQYAINKLFHGETSFKCPYGDLDGVVNGSHKSFSIKQSVQVHLR